MQGEDRGHRRPWLRSKSFDTFCPVGPFVVARDGLPGYADLAIRLRVGESLRQDSRTSAMVFDVPQAISWLSRHTTLRPGDILATGTPEGVGPIQAGDTVTCFVERVGTLQNPVVREELR